MKALFYTIVFAMIANVLQAQNIYSVSNIEGSGADFTSLQEALDEAEDGDIFLVQGSAENYGNFIVDKQVAIYGPGYVLGQNEEPFTQANTAHAEISNAQFDEGAEGSLISGVVITGALYCQSDMVVTRNNLRGAITTAFSSHESNVIFRQNYFTGVALLANSNCDAWIYEGNIFNRNLSNLVQSASMSGFVFRNNTFYYNSTSGTVSYITWSAVFENNIFLTAGADVEFSNTTGVFENNITSGTGSFNSIGGENLDGVDPEDLLVGLSGSIDSSEDGFFVLLDNSPAVDYGNDGGECGAFGGSYPYVFSGIPEIPNIFFLDVPTSASTSDGLEIHLKAKSNN